MAKLFSAGIVFCVLLASCASFPGSSFGPRSEAVPTINAVLDAGQGLLGQKPDAKVQVNGRKFTLDCVGTLSAAWWAAGVDLQQDFFRYRGNAVNRLYQSLQARGALHWQRTPIPGDLIFWDHTWDTGSDPTYAEGHTHAGMVLSVASDGTIAYLHESETRGVVVAYMNLYDTEGTVRSDGKVVNSPMYLGSGYGKKTNPSRWTSGQLWSAFGDGSVVALNFGG